MTPTSLSRTKSAVALASAVVAVGLLTSACSSDDPEGGASQSPAPTTSSSDPTPSNTEKSPSEGGDSTLTISGFEYSALTVEPGAEVTVTNDDSDSHTVTVEDADIDVTVEGKSDATFKAPTKPGDYTITCDFHGDMQGSMTVSS